MISFAWPWAVLLLPLPWLAQRWWPAPREDASDPHPALRHPRLAELANAYGGATGNLAIPPDWHAWLPTMLWILLILALMQPQWLREQTAIQQRGYDLMLAVDLSRSMKARDFHENGVAVDRLHVVKQVLSEFIRQRKGDRLGLILFGNAAYVQAPLTLDHEAVRAMLLHASAGMAGDATALGDAIGVAVKKLRDRPQGSRVLILLTDGESTAGSLPPAQAATLAAQFGIRIYTIGVGTTGEIELPAAGSGKMVLENLKLDETVLRAVAERTGGQYFRATDTQALEAIYQSIDTLEKTQAETRRAWIPEPLYRLPLGGALGILLLIAIRAWREEGVG